MAFTYNLSSSDQAVKNISRVRLELGDISANAGVRPDNSNLQDEEIALWLSEESNDIQRTVARACSALSKQWSTVANITVGPRKEELGKVAKEWADRAKESAPVDTTSFTINVSKVNNVHDPYQYRPEEQRGL